MKAVQAVHISLCFASTACYGQTVFSEINCVVKTNVLALSAQPGFAAGLNQSRVARDVVLWTEKTSSILFNGSIESPMEIEP